MEVQQNNRKARMKMGLTIFFIFNWASYASDSL